MDKHEFENIKKKLRLTNQGISDTMGVRLHTVQCWADGVWEIPLMAEKFLRTLLSVERDKEAVYMMGLGRGRNAGLKEGKEEGRLDAVEGYTTGYGEGHIAGYRTAMEAVGGLVEQ